MGSTWPKYYADFERNQGRFTEQVWTCNRAGFWHHDIDLIFAMDDMRLLGNYFPGTVERNQRITSRNIPLVTSTVYPEFDNAVAYPLKAVIKRLTLGAPQKILTNTLCYMLALAIARGAEVIHLYGFDFIEHAAVKPPKEGEPWWHVYYRGGESATEPGLMGLCFLVGLAEAWGISINIPEGSTLFDMDKPNFFYGYPNPRGMFIA